MIHKNIEGKAKCGSAPYHKYSWNFQLSTNDSLVNCKRCLNTVKRECTFEPIAENMVGKIFHTSWGYDMTINEYVKVIKQDEKSLLVQECYTKTNGQEYGWTSQGEAMAGGVKPDGKKFRVFNKVRRYNDYKGNPAMYQMWVGKLHECATSWSLWDGKPDYENHND